MTTIHKDDPQHPRRINIDTSVASRPGPEAPTITVEQFRAWFEGYCDALGNSGPAKADWEIVKRKVAQLSDRSMKPHPAFRDIRDPV